HGVLGGMGNDRTLNQYACVYSVPLKESAAADRLRSSSPRPTPAGVRGRDRRRMATAKTMSDLQRRGGPRPFDRVSALQRCQQWLRQIQRMSLNDGRRTVWRRQTTADGPRPSRLTRTIAPIYGCWLLSGNRQHPNNMSIKRKK